MDIFEFALKMEEDGKKFYLELAEKATDEGVRNILKMLAADEDKHIAAIKLIKEEQASMPETEILGKSKTIFAEMKDRNETIDVSTTPLELYKKAKEIEDRNTSFYLERAQESESDVHKNFFMMLVEEEKKHSYLLENVIEFISQPDVWLENAEFNQLDNY